MDVIPISLRTLEDHFVSPCSEDRRAEAPTWADDDPTCRERMDRSNCMDRSPEAQMVEPVADVARA